MGRGITLPIEDTRGTTASGEPQRTKKSSKVHKRNNLGLPQLTKSITANTVFHPALQLASSCRMRCRPVVSSRIAPLESKDYRPSLAIPLLRDPVLTYSHFFLIAFCDSWEAYMLQLCRCAANPCSHRLCSCYSTQPRSFHRRPLPIAPSAAAPAAEIPTRRESKLRDGCTLDL